MYKDPERRKGRENDETPTWSVICRLVFGTVSVESEPDSEKGRRGERRHRGLALDEKVGFVSLEFRVISS